MEQSNTECKRSLTREFSRQMDADYLYIRENRTQAQTGIIANIEDHEKSNTTFENICNEKDNRFRRQTNPNAEFSRSVSPHERRFSSFDDNPNPREESSLTRSSPHSVKEIEFQMMKPTEESYDSFIHPIPAAKVRGTDFDYYVNAVPKSSAEPMSGKPWASRLDCRTKRKGGNMQNLAPLMQTVENNSASDVKEESGDTLNNVNSVLVGSIRCTGRNTNPNRTIEKPNERGHQREMITTSEGNHEADSLDEDSPQVGAYQRKWSQQRERSSLEGTSNTKPVIALHERDQGIKCANSPPQATVQTKQKSCGNYKIPANGLSNYFDDPTYQYFKGVRGWEINFQTAFDGCPRTEAEFRTLNNLSKSSMPDMKQSFYQPLSFGSHKNQPPFSSMYLNFTSSPQQHVSNISSGSIDEKTQNNYFAELDKDLASTPNYNHISKLRSKLRENEITSTAHRIESSKVTDPADSFREMSAMGGSSRNHIIDKKLDMFLKRKTSPNCSAMVKDDHINKPNEYPEPDDSVKRPSSPGLKNIMQIFENTVANVQRSSFLVDHNIPVEPYPFERSNRFVNSQGDWKFTRLFGQECELWMFDRVQQRKFRSRIEKRELTWQGDYEFISIGNPPGLSVRHIDKELIRQMVTVINRRRPKFVVVCAQLIQNVESNWSISDLEDGNRKKTKEWGAFHEIYSKIVRCIPLVFVRGNYNVDSNLSKARIKYNNEFQDNYFTFWAGGVRYIVLNSQIMQRLETSDELSFAHEKWFNAELTRQHKRNPVHLVVFCRIPPFCYDIDEMNTNFNWPRRKRVIWLDKMVAANVKKIYCAQFERSFRRVYKGLEIVASASIGTKIFTKPIPNKCKLSRLKEGNSRLNFDTAAINSSEEMCGLQIVKVSRNVLTERWLSVTKIKKSINLHKEPDNPHSHLVLSKFMMRNEFIPSAWDTGEKPTSELLLDIQRAPDIIIPYSSDRNNEALQQPNEGKDNVGLRFKYGAKLDPPNLSNSFTQPAAFKPSEAMAISKNSHQDMGQLSIKSKSIDDSKSNIETKLSKSSSQETEKFIFAKEAVFKSTQKSVKPWQFLPQQVAYSNKTISSRSFGKDWNRMNLKTSIPHNEKKQNYRVYPTRNSRKSRMKLQAESKTQDVGIALEKNKTTQSSGVAEWSVQDVLRWLTNLDPIMRKYCKVFMNQRIDGRRLLVLKDCDLLDLFIQSREDVILIVSALEKLVPTPPELGWVSKDGRNHHRFRIKELMHIGEFSTTHQAFDLNNGNRICAMKLVCRKNVKDHFRKQNTEKVIIRELALKRFFSKNPKKRHVNMISFYEHCEKVSYRGAIYDWIVIREHHSYDLGLLTENRVPLGKDISRRILHQLVSLLCFFRVWKVGHFDLQPKNLLVQEEGWIIKVAGWSNYRQFTQIRYYTDAVRHIYNRSHYMAPELWEQREYGLSADSWSVGVILYNLITGYLPFEHRRRADPAYNALIENNSEAF